MFPILMRPSTAWHINKVFFYRVLIRAHLSSFGKKSCRRLLPFFSSSYIFFWCSRRQKRIPQISKCNFRQMQRTFCLRYRRTSTVRDNVRICGCLCINFHKIKVDSLRCIRNKSIFEAIIKVLGVSWELHIHTSWHQ